jgi:hypothetical protein
VTRQHRDDLIEGYITNTWGFAARDVRGLVTGHDSSGTQTGQVIAWGPNAIQPGDRVYFDVTVPAGSALEERSPGVEAAAGSREVPLTCQSRDGHDGDGAAAGELRPAAAVFRNRRIETDGPAWNIGDWPD